MIFGDPNDFAVEAYHEPFSKETKSVFGRMCIHINGRTFGDIHEKSCGLWGAVSSLHEIAQQLDVLWDDSFEGLSAYDLFELLDTAMYRDVGQTLAETQQDWERYGKFNFLTNWGEQFDHGISKAFIVRAPDHRLQILWRDENGQQQTSTCSTRAFREASESVFHWFHEEASSL